ncbi:MAG: hypothetical protein ABIH92_01040 [Nanoarchaeota archaeon]
MRRSYNMPDTEPDQKSFELPSEKEHCFFVVDILDDIDPDPDVIHVKLEVVEGEEAGRTLLNRLNLDENFKGFFAVRLFLKAIGLPHKGKVEIDTEDFIGRQFYATVRHSADGKYANIDQYNFEKIVEQPQLPKTEEKEKDDEEVEWDA